MWGLRIMLGGSGLPHGQCKGLWKPCSQAAVGLAAENVEQAPAAAVQGLVRACSWPGQYWHKEHLPSWHTSMRTGLPSGQSSTLWLRAQQQARHQCSLSTHACLNTSEEG